MRSPAEWRAERAKPVRRSVGVAFCRPSAFAFCARGLPGCAGTVMPSRRNGDAVAPVPRCRLAGTAMPSRRNGTGRTRQAGRTRRPKSCRILSKTPHHVLPISTAILSPQFYIFYTARFISRRDTQSHAERGEPININRVENVENVECGGASQSC